MPAAAAALLQQPDEPLQQGEAIQQRLKALLEANSAGSQNGEPGIVEIRPASPRATTNYSQSFLTRVKNFVMTPFKAVASLFPKAGYFLASREIRKNLAKEGAVTYDVAQATRRIANLNRASTDRLVSDIALMERIDEAPYGFDDGSNRSAYFLGLCEDINRRRSFWMKDTIQSVFGNEEPLRIERLLSQAVNTMDDKDLGVEQWMSCVQNEFARLARQLGSKERANLMNEFHSIKEKISHFDTHRALEGGLILFSMES